MYIHIVVKLLWLVKVHILYMSCVLLQDEVDIILARGKSLGVSNVRFMPKTSSLRPITNLGSAAKLNHNHFVLSGFCQRERKPVNAQLLDLFKILKFEKVCIICTYSEDFQYVMSCDVM